MFSSCKGINSSYENNQIKDTFEELKLAYIIV